MSTRLRFSLANFYETYSENDDLQKGDVIKKIDEYDVRDLRPKNTQQPPVLPKSPIPPPSPIDIPEQYSVFAPEHYTPAHDHLDEVREERYYLSQPYRTTPLVLPGAKIKKDAPLGECYLRHHPNPMVRAPPHHYEIANPEVAMKQKVVSKQFNSPIGLYSEQNIADTIKCQASAIPTKKKFDPNLSEAYKALQEESEGHVQQISQPTRQGVFSPQKARNNKPAPFRPRSPAVNIVDNDGETIHQSNSFKRIMYSVLGETEY